MSSGVTSHPENEFNNSENDYPENQFSDPENYNFFKKYERVMYSYDNDPYNESPADPLPYINDLLSYWDKSPSVPYNKAQLLKLQKFLRPFIELLIESHIYYRDDELIKKSIRLLTKFSELPNGAEIIENYMNKEFKGAWTSGFVPPPSLPHRTLPSGTVNFITYDEIEPGNTMTNFRRNEKRFESNEGQYYRKNTADKFSIHPLTREPITNRVNYIANIAAPEENLLGLGNNEYVDPRKKNVEANFALLSSPVEKGGRRRSCRKTGRAGRALRRVSRKRRVIE